MRKYESKRDKVIKEQIKEYLKFPEKPTEKMTPKELEQFERQKASVKFNRKHRNSKEIKKVRRKYIEPIQK